MSYSTLTYKACGLVYDAVPAGRRRRRGELMMQKLMINQAYENMGLAIPQARGDGAK